MSLLKVTLEISGKPHSYLLVTLQVAKANALREKKKKKENRKEGREKGREKQAATTTPLRKKEKKNPLKTKTKPSEGETKATYRDILNHNHS